jgi:hypothetical protein
MLRFLNGRNTVTSNILHQLVCAATLGQYSASAVAGDVTNSKHSNVQCFRIPRRLFLKIQNRTVVKTHSLDPKPKIQLKLQLYGLSRNIL